MNKDIRFRGVPYVADKLYALHEATEATLVQFGHASYSTDEIVVAVEPEPEEPEPEPKPVKPPKVYMKPMKPNLGPKKSRRKWMR
jgi:hypothetical protein